jgi:hypothetical protein
MWRLKQGIKIKYYDEYNILVLCVVSKTRLWAKNNHQVKDAQNHKYDICPPLIPSNTIPTAAIPAVNVFISTDKMNVAKRCISSLIAKKLHNSAKM